MDVFTPEKRSEIMSKIRGKGTKPESKVFRYLRRNKIYFQKHYKNAPGKPDIALPRKKIAVFIDGDFWHGYSFSKWKDRIPKEYWQQKIASNIRRDRRNFARLKKEGWNVMRVWEHELTVKKEQKTLERIKLFMTTDHEESSR